MPIWLALYRMLSSTGELYQQPFIPGWINDLTAADPYHVLPVVLMITMFVQARLQPAAPTDPSQKMQQRMMQYGMPLMFGVMSFFFPAGLTLYIFTNTCLTRGALDLHEQVRQEEPRRSPSSSRRRRTKAAASKAKGARREGEGRQRRRRSMTTMTTRMTRRRCAVDETRREVTAASAAEPQEAQEAPAIGYGGSCDETTES